jgi:fibronectin type 3 domain-containing protein
VGVSQEGGVYLRFTPGPMQDTAGYFIERQDKKGGAWSRLNAKVWLENTFVDKDVQVGASYLYRVVAVDEEGQLSQPCPAVEIKHQP